MRKIELEKLLTRRLKLETPRFKLQKFSNKLCGSVISDSFKRKGDHIRQKMIWDALNDEFGPESIHRVGTLLAYTNDEWDVDLPAKAG